MPDGCIILLFSIIDSYSGRIAAESFAHMQGMDVDRVIVLGPCHRYYSEYLQVLQVTHSKCMLTTAKKVETPLGELEVDVAAQEELNKDVHLIFSILYIFRICLESVV